MRLLSARCSSFIARLFLSLCCSGWLFIVLAVLHEKVLASIGLRGRAIRFYEVGLARVQDRWAGTGETGERFLDPAHPYARDLDIFGRASLFELLCTARTRAGEETLAAWLLTAADPWKRYLCGRKRISRTEGAREVSRESCFRSARRCGLGVKPEALSAWGERGPVFASARDADRDEDAGSAVDSEPGVLGSVGPGRGCSGDDGFELGVGTSDPCAAGTALRMRWRRRRTGLELLAGVLALLEQERFSAPKLVTIQDALRRKGTAPSAAIRRLARIVE